MLYHDLMQVLPSQAAMLGNLKHVTMHHANTHTHTQVQSSHVAVSHLKDLSIWQMAVIITYLTNDSVVTESNSPTAQHR